MVKRLNQNDFIEKATMLHAGRYTYEKTVYTVSSAKIIVTCPFHGDFEVTANNHVSKSNLCGCPVCGGTKKLSFEEFIEKSRKVHGDKYDYSQAEYAGTQLHITVICPEHGAFFQTPTRHINGRGCHQCGGTKKIAMYDAIEKAKKLHKDFYSYEEVNINAPISSEVTITCPRHGEFSIPMKHHVNRMWGCPKCSCRSSKPEDELADFLAEHTPVIRRNRSILAPKEVDIWLPEHNLAIEFHGLYWHTKNRVGNLHREKWDMANKAGVRLVQIFEDEWLNKREIVKNRLLAFIGKSPKLDARKLKVSLVQWKNAKEFLLSTHIQGAGPIGTAYGLYDGEILVAVATFGKSRSGAMTGSKKDGEYEVLRYASTGSVRGGFTRLFAAFKTDCYPEIVISYCDLRYGTGKLYETSGFELSGITEPDYWWVPKARCERVPRYNVQKHKIANPQHLLNKFYSPNKTENQICSEAGWEKILGVGNQKWIWRKNA